jgi:hypothetical protein
MMFIKPARNGCKASTAIRTGRAFASRLTFFHVNCYFPEWLLNADGYR